MRKRIEKILTERDGISAKEARIKVLHARRRPLCPIRGR
jgi:hypothetical protein